MKKMIFTSILISISLLLHSKEVDISQIEYKYKYKLNYLVTKGDDVKYDVKYEFKLNPVMQWENLKVYENIPNKEYDALKNLFNQQIGDAH